MKKLLIIFATILLTMSLVFGTTVIVQAEEVPTESTQTSQDLPSTDEVIDNLGGTLTEEEKAVIKDLVDKVKGYTESSDSFFIRYIVPIIVAVGLCFILGLLFVIPWCRKNLKLKDAENMLDNAREQLDGYKKAIEELKKQVDSAGVKNDIKEYVKKQFDSIGTMLECTLKQNGVEIEKIEACIQALINGAINAWHGSPEAISCLTSVASATELKNLAEENAKLTALVYKLYGDEASKVLGDL